MIDDLSTGLADISKAQRILGYDPLIDLETGLERTIEWVSRCVSG